MRDPTDRERSLESFKAEAKRLAFWSRFGKIMAGYVAFVVVLWIFGDFSSSTPWHIITVTVAWAVVGALVSLDVAGREAQASVDRLLEHERRVRDEIAKEKGTARPPS